MNKFYRKCCYNPKLEKEAFENGMLAYFPQGFSALYKFERGWNVLSNCKLISTQIFHMK